MSLGFNIASLSDLSDDEMIDVVRNVNNFVTDPETRKILKARHFLGVLARHSGSQAESRTSLIKAREAAPRTLRAFVILETLTGQPVGMASKQPNLNLERQLVPLPPVLSRQSEFGVQIQKFGANVAAWVHSGIDQRDALSEIYGHLRGLSPNGAWTIEPIDSIAGVHAGIKEGGFIPVSQGRYDDEEHNWRIPPKSIYYTSPTF